MVNNNNNYIIGSGVGATSISIKEKQEYLVPVYATDKWGNDHKVLRRNSGNILSND